MQVGNNRLAGAALSVSVAPQVTRPNYPFDTYDSDADTDWNTDNGSILTDSYPGDSDYFDNNYVLWDQAADATVTVRADAGAAVGGDRLVLSGSTGASGILRPKAITIQYSDNDSDWTTVRSLSGMSGGATPERGWAVETDISGSGEHRYWRATFTHSSQFFALGAIEIWENARDNPLLWASVTHETAPDASYPDGGVDIIGISDTDYQDQQGSLLTDGGVGAESFALGYVGKLTSAANYVQMDAGTAVGGDRLQAIGYWGSDQIGRPTAYTLEYSDNATDWTEVEAVTGLTAGGVVGPRQWLLDIDISAAGEHRYWRLDLQQGYTSWLFVSEVLMIASDGWREIGNRAGYTADDTPNASYPDTNVATLRSEDADWQTDEVYLMSDRYPGLIESITTKWAGYDLTANQIVAFTFTFPEAEEIDHVAIYGQRGGTGSIFSPESLWVQYSDNGSDWTEAVSQTGMTPSSTSQAGYLAKLVTGETDSHQYWRVRIQHGGGNGQFLFLGDIRFWQTSGSPAPPVPPSPTGRVVRSPRYGVTRIVTR